jgi:predicted PhzF superfamily epimerase YddE/YHI9
VKLPIFQLDAFTTRRFCGNPAAVVILTDDWLADDLLQAIAAENNLSETAFALARSELIPLRWFTPKIEVDLCGHATLASAYVFLKYYFAAQNEVRFSTRSGQLAVARRGTELAMDFPARPGTRVAVTGDIISALGAEPIEAYLARDLLAVFSSESEVAALRPDPDKIAGLDAFAVIASAKGDQVDFVSRFFAPRAGIPEDPVTGSAHCTLTPYWANRLAKNILCARQLSPRGGELTCEMNGERVVIAGGVIEYLHGEISI